MSDKSLSEPTPLRIALGLIAFGAFLLQIAADALPQYDPSPYFAALTVGSFLVLLGFGALIRYLAEVRYE